MALGLVGLFSRVKVRDEVGIRTRVRVWVSVSIIHGFICPDICLELQFFHVSPAYNATAEDDSFRIL